MKLLSWCNAAIRGGATVSSRKRGNVTTGPRGGTIGRRSSCFSHGLTQTAGSTATFTSGSTRASAIATSGAHDAAGTRAGGPPPGRPPRPAVWSSWRQDPYAGAASSSWTPGPARRAGAAATSPAPREARSHGSRWRFSGPDRPISAGRSGSCPPGCGSDRCRSRPGSPRRSDARRRARRRRTPCRQSD
jgi:hypothetical protein